jgi:hypothetical protein
MNYALLKTASLHMKPNPNYKLRKLHQSKQPFKLHHIEWLCKNNAWTKRLPHFITLRPRLKTSHKRTHWHSTSLIYTPSPTLRQPHVYLRNLQAIVAAWNNSPLRQHKPYKTPRTLHMRPTRLRHAPTSTHR